MPPRASLLALTLVVVACAPEEKPRPPPSTDVFGGDRPVTLQVPYDYDHERPYPLLVVLHGYQVNGFLQMTYLGLDKLADEEGVLVVAPDGTVNDEGLRFWNATDACCNFYESQVDDVAYLTGLVRDISAEYNVDTRRIYLLGHSNGGFMSHRLACERADLFAGLVGIAGATWANEANCKPSEPVSVLQIHGTADAKVLYEGATESGEFFKHPYPGAKETVERWRNHNGCAGAVSSELSPLGLFGAEGGEETKRLAAAGCPKNTAVELWSIEDGAHIPPANRTFASVVWGWMAAHPKP